MPLDQGRFLEEMLEPVDGFLVLDMHNLYCQIHNFGVSADDLFDAYPLDRSGERFREDFKRMKTIVAGSGHAG